ncbi:MAG TPA: VOC family protein [Stellaceae bacterium]|nr:VOC family protein [Stellaceae bacterium]
MQDEDRRRAAWPQGLARLGGIRFARRYHKFHEAVAFYRDIVGLPLHEIFEESYGSSGAIFALPDPSITFEIVQAAEPVAIDPHEQLCLYFEDAAAMTALRDRLAAAGIAPVAAHPYWQATGAIAYRDPEGRGLVLAPFVYGRNEPAAGAATGSHAFPEHDRKALRAHPP